MSGEMPQYHESAPMHKAPDTAEYRAAVEKSKAAIEKSRQEYEKKRKENEVMIIPPDQMAEIRRQLDKDLEAARNKIKNLH